MPNVFINCCHGGGLGNRFGTIIGGMRVAKRLGFSPVICWLPSPECYATIEDLCSVVPADVVHEAPDPSLPLIARKEHQRGRPWLPKEKALTMKGDFEYATHRYDAPARDILSRFVVHPDIRSHVDAFVQQHGIDKSWTGIHVRGTDAASSKRINEAKALAKRSRKVFVCSDDPDIEALFAGMKNVTLHPKNHWVRRANQDFSWRITEGDKTYYNVHRSSEATIEGFQDLLILARTSFKCRASTFCKLARSL